jgi:radical SAM superfamily enzyme YgiQ (UPF0313 family)
MKINMVSLEDGIIALGFRKMAAFMERVNPDTRIHYVGTPRYRSVMKSLKRNLGDKPPFGPDEIDEIAQGLAGADVVACSSMSGYSDLTKSVIKRVREINKNAYVMWGGIHPIIHPEDAIQADVDAICVGEGEFAFAEWLHHMERGTDPTNIHNFWFKTNGQIKRNPTRPLMTPAELETLPFQKYGGEEWMYRAQKGFTKVTLNDYLDNNGLGYPAIWSIGCPLHCTFCGNTVFIANDPKYARIRHTSPAYMVEEIARARKIHPHLSTVLFHDDSFMAIPIKELTDFATTWREKVGLSFVVFGVIPTYVRRDKMEVLTWAGLQRVRMGIQSGSERILNFYKRPVPIPKVEHAAEVISEFKDYQINPVYDMIVDNPVETRQDVIDSLELVYRMARPFTLNLFSLRIIPNTVLEQQMHENGIDLEMINGNYMALRPTWANALTYLLLWYKPPRWLFDKLLTRVRAFNEEQPAYRFTLLMMRLPWLMQQGLRHLKWGEFSVITGKWGYVLWKSGILPIWWKLFRPKFDLPADHTPLGPQAGEPTIA